MPLSPQHLVVALTLLGMCSAGACNEAAVNPPADVQSQVDGDTIEDAAEIDSSEVDTEPYEPFVLEPVVAWGRERGNGGEGHGPDDFSFPSGIAVSRDDREIYVNDTGNQRIKVLSREGETLRTWPVTSCISVGETIAVGLDGTIFVTDGGTHEIVGYSPLGSELRRWSIAGARPSCTSGSVYSNPILVAPGGDLYVGDLQLGQIQQFTPDGDLVRTFGGLGEEKGRFALGPLGLVLANGILYAPDVLVRFSPSQERFLLFDTTGNFQGYLPTVRDDPYFYFATALTEHNGWIAAIRDEDPPIVYLKPPTAKTFVYRWTSEGRNPSLGDLNSPFALAIAKDGLWYVTESYNHRVQVMRPSIAIE